MNLKTYQTTFILVSENVLLKKENEALKKENAELRSRLNLNFD